jgi:hypothetical protein
MDECARETTLEAMQQNNIRPFTTAREDIQIRNVSIPPPSKKKNKAEKGGKKKKGMAATTSGEDVVESEPEAVEPQWLSFDDMKGAIDAGWRVSQPLDTVTDASLRTSPTHRLLLAMNALAGTEFQFRSYKCQRSKGARQCKHSGSQTIGCKLLAAVARASLKTVALLPKREREMRQSKILL